MVQTLVQSHSRYLLLRGKTYYFRFVLPRHVRQLCPFFPREIKRSLSTDNLATALYLINEKLDLISLIKRCRDGAQLSTLVSRLKNFTDIFRRLVDNCVQRTAEERAGDSHDTQVKVVGPKLSEAWKDFAKSKRWSDKAQKNNRLLFASIQHFVGDIPVGAVTKRLLKDSLFAISQLPQRNKKRYKGLPLKQLFSMQIPDEDRVSSKTVKEHLKLCQGFFSSYLVKERDVLEQSPTEGISLEGTEKRFASLGDTQVCQLIERSLGKPEWFQWMLLLAVYSGARRSELARLRSSDFKVCPDTGRHHFVVQHGKTSAAQRQVPVHNRLIERGIIEWVKEKDGLLFPVAHTNPNRATDMFTSLVNAKVNDLGERVVFHSLRHTFITKARSEGVETVLVQQVVGHEKSGAGLMGRYAFCE